MRDIVIVLIVFGSLPFILARPYIGVLMWSWLGYMNPHRLAYGFAYDFPFAQVVAIAIIAGLLFSREPKRIPLNSLTISWFMFLLWMVVTTIFAISHDVSQEQLIKVVKIQLVAVITLMVISDRARLNMLIWVIVLSIGYYGIKGGVFTIGTGGSHHVWGPSGSFIQGNNELALALLMIIPLANYLRSIAVNIWVQRGMLLVMLLMGVSAIGSQSRGALLAAGAVMVWFWLKSRQKLKMGIALLLIGTSVVVFMPSSWHERMDTIDTYEEDASAMGRINAWQAAISLASSRFTGGGFDGINIRSIFVMHAPIPEKYHDAHSIYFEVLGDHGIPGLLLFLLVGILAFKKSNELVRRTHDVKELAWLNTLARMIQVSLIAYATGGAFLGLAYFDLFYHLLAIIVIGTHLVEKHVMEFEQSEILAAELGGRGANAENKRSWY